MATQAQADLPQAVDAQIDTIDANQNDQFEELNGLNGQELVDRSNDIAIAALQESSADAIRHTEAMQSAVQQLSNRLDLPMPPELQDELRAAQDALSAKIAEAGKIFTEQMQDANGAGGNTDLEAAWDAFDYKNLDSYGDLFGAGADKVAATWNSLDAESTGDIRDPDSWANPLEAYQSLNLDNDLAGAPEGSKTREAWNMMQKLKANIIASKQELASLPADEAVRAIMLRNEITASKNELRDIQQNMPTTIAEDKKDSIDVAAKEHLEARADALAKQQDIANLARNMFNGEKIPADYLDAGYANDPAVLLKLAEAKAVNGRTQNYDTMGSFFTGGAPTELFANAEDLYASLTEEAKQAIDGLYGENALVVINNAIALHNVKEYIAKRQAIIDGDGADISNYSVAEEGTSQPTATPQVVPPVAPAVPAAEAAPAPQAAPPVVESDSAPQVIPASVPVASAEAVDSNRLSALEASLNFDNNTADAFNKNAELILMFLDANNRLSVFGPGVTNSLEKGGRNNRGLESVVALQKSLGFSGRDIDGFLGKKTFDALKIKLANLDSQSAFA